jgi:hypothetical protein
MVELCTLDVNYMMPLLCSVCLIDIIVRLILNLGDWLLDHRDGGGFSFVHNHFVVELGCGSTGIPGIASLAAGAISVTFCDIDQDAITELSTNIQRNFPSIIAQRNSNLSYQVEIIPDQLPYDFITDNWKHLLLLPNPTSHLSGDDQGKVIIASEIIYDAISITDLAHLIHNLLCINPPLEEGRTHHCVGEGKDECGKTVCRDGVFVLCQSRSGRGKVVEEFISLMTTQYDFTYQDVDYQYYDHTAMSPYDGGEDNSTTVPLLSVVGDSDKCGNRNDELIFRVFRRAQRI